MRMAFFTKEQTALRQEQEAAYDRIISQVIFYPGSIMEYERKIDHPIREIDTLERDKGIRFIITGYGCNIEGSFELKRNMAENGIEAIVNARYLVCADTFRKHSVIYGLPVTRQGIVPR